jgi:hypothetical protein
MDKTIAAINGKQKNHTGGCQAPDKKGKVR